MERRKRLSDGTFGPVEKVGTKETDAEKVERLEQESAIILYESMMKDARIADLEAAQAQADEIQSEILYALMNGGIL